MHRSAMPDLPNDGQAMSERERQMFQEITFLHRARGLWSRDEVALLRAHLKDENGYKLKQEAGHPAFLALAGHFSESQIKGVLGSTCASFSVILVTGTNDPTIPFDPRFPVYPRKH